MVRALFLFYVVKGKTVLRDRKISGGTDVESGFKVFAVKAFLSFIRLEDHLIGLAVSLKHPIQFQVLQMGLHCIILA